MRLLRAAGYRIRGLDRVLVALGLRSPNPSRVDAAIAEQLELLAEFFFRAGGRLSLEDLGELSRPELEALVKAAEKVWATRATKLASSIRSLAGAAAVLAPYDAGVSRRTLEVLAAMEGLEPRVDEVP